MTPPRQGEALAAALPGSTFRLLPAAGHMLMLEQPEPVIAAIASFLAALGR
jgi:pimeloyl-ACP methyl ester carboxylesterase